MPDSKKEVLDYLRNIQKSAEIEAKVNGINIWVLLGAIGIVAWQAIESLEKSNPDVWLILKSITLTSTILVLFTTIRPNSGYRNDIRYSSLRISEMIAPWFGVAEGLWLLWPALTVTIMTRTASSLIVIFFGAFSTLICICAILIQLGLHKKSNDRFPKPNFGISKKVATRIEVITAAILIASLYFQAATIISSWQQFDASKLRSALIISALYLLVAVVIARKMRSHRIDWTYDLETDVVLGHLTPEAALQKIEHRALGPLLKDVMDKFFEEVDRDFDELQGLMKTSTAEVLSMRNIPKEYPAERKARKKAATEPAIAKIRIILSKCKDLTSYIEKLRLRRMNEALLRNLLARTNKYTTMLDAASSELEIMIRDPEEQELITEVKSA